MDNENKWDRVLDEFVIPHVTFPQDTVQQKKKIAWHITLLHKEELLFASASAFSYEGIIAGITIEQIEYFVKNASINQKKELAKVILNKDISKAVYAIGKMMDEDLGDGVIQNQKRIKNVYRYIIDNWIAFQF